MTTTLVVLRHAQAVPAGAGADHARALTAAGEQQAGAAGSRLRSRGLRPDVVVTSDAVRARRTTDLVLGDDPWPVRVEPDVYEASPPRLAALLESAGDVTGTTLLVCHEPGASGLAVALAGPPTDERSASLRARLLGGLGTAEAAVLAWDADEVRLCAGSARLVDVVGPGDD